MTIASYTMWIRSESSILAAGDEDGIVVLRQPPSGGCRLKYHATGSGQISFTARGRFGTELLQETVSFTAPRWYLGVRMFTRLDSIEANGPKGFTAQIEAVNSSGNPITWTTIDGPYAVSVRRTPRDAERIAEAGEARTAHEYYILATDEEGLQVAPGQRFTISELPEMEFEVWSSMKPVATPLGETILRKEFIARRLSP